MTAETTNRPGKSVLWIGAAAVIGAGAIIGKQLTTPGGDAAATGSTRASAAITCTCYTGGSLSNVPITFTSTVPGDLNSFNNQSKADCFAWQEFIALNWPVNTSHGFGDPMDYSQVQWETYMPRDVLFQPGGAPPPAWGTLVSDKFVKKFKSQKLLLNNRVTKLLTFTSKFFESDTVANLSPDQAAPGGPNWFGATNSTNLWYDVLINQDYYNFVVSRGYYNAKTQHDSADLGIPLNFPKGVYNGPTGAIELKAAWMEVDNPGSPKWKRYKLSVATVMDATTETLRTTTVALVGLHILHKTQNQPTWVWATFEQIDNVPGTGSAPPYGYNLYNAATKTQTLTVKALSGRGDTQVVVSNTPNTPPPYYLSQAKPVPLQCTRVNAIDAITAAPINTQMQASIKANYPNSVFQYYQLVDVIWSQSLQADPTTTITVPRNINVSSMASGDIIVANTTMETYVQSTSTCFSCHKFGSIADYPPDASKNNVFGDFSFAIGFAQYSPTARAVRKTKP